MNISIENGKLIIELEKKYLIKTQEPNSHNLGFKIKDEEKMLQWIKMFLEKDNLFLEFLDDVFGQAYSDGETWLEGNYFGKKR